MNALQVVKFICKEFWIYLFGRQVRARGIANTHTSASSNANANATNANANANANVHTTS